MFVFGIPSRQWDLLNNLSSYSFDDIYEGAYKEVRTIAASDPVVLSFVRDVLGQGRALKQIEFFAIQTRHERLTREASSANQISQGKVAQAALQAS